MNVRRGERKREETHLWSQLSSQLVQHRRNLAISTTRTRRREILLEHIWIASHILKHAYRILVHTALTVEEKNSRSNSTASSLGSTDSARTPLTGR
jgi:hypothetical protein